MPSSLEERVAYLEGKVDEQSRLGVELRDTIFHLDQKVDRFREELASRIDALDQKVDRFREELASRIDALDRKVDRFREELASRIDALDQKLSRYFLWIVGIQVSILLAIVATHVRS